MFRLSSAHTHTFWSWLSISNICTKFRRQSEFLFSYFVAAFFFQGPRNLMPSLVRLNRLFQIFRLFPHLTWKKTLQTGVLFVDCTPSPPPTVLTWWNVGRKKFCKKGEKTDENQLRNFAAKDVVMPAATGDWDGIFMYLDIRRLSASRTWQCLRAVDFVTLNLKWNNWQVPWLLWEITQVSFKAKSLFSLNSASFTPLHAAGDCNKRLYTAHYWPSSLIVQWW